MAGLLLILPGGARLATDIMIIGRTKEWGNHMLLHKGIRWAVVILVVPIPLAVMTINHVHHTRLVAAVAKVEAFRTAAHNAFYDSEYNDLTSSLNPKDSSGVVTGIRMKTSYKVFQAQQRFDMVFQSSYNTYAANINPNDPDIAGKLMQAAVAAQADADREGSLYLLDEVLHEH
jgi:hypothetical protein